MRFFNFLLLLFTAFFSATGQKVLLREDFSSNANNWPQYHDTTALCEIRNGKFVMENYDNGAAWSIIPGPECEDGSTVSVRATHVKGRTTNGYGLVFGANKKWESYVFQVTHQGFYTAYRNRYQGSDLIHEDVLPWKTHPAILKGSATNDLMVKMSGWFSYLYVNQTLIDSFRTDDLFGYGVGLITSKNQHVEFDDLEVRSLSSDPGRPSPEEVEFKLVVIDDFSENFFQWPERTDEGRIIKLQNGVYYFENFQNSTNATTIDMREFLVSDFRLNVDATHIKGYSSYGYGLVFNGTFSTGFYEFTITASGAYSIGRVSKKDAPKELLVNWKVSKHIRTGEGKTNKLGIQKKNSTYEFYINDVLVETLYGLVHYDGFLGFRVAGAQGVSFDNLEIYNRAQKKGGQKRDLPNKNSSRQNETEGERSMKPPEHNRPVLKDQKN